MMNLIILFISAVVISSAYAKTVSDMLTCADAVRTGSCAQTCGANLASDSQKKLDCVNQLSSATWPTFVSCVNTKAGTQDCFDAAKLRSEFNPGVSSSSTSTSTSTNNGEFNLHQWFSVEMPRQTEAFLQNMTKWNTDLGNNISTFFSRHFRQVRQSGNEFEQYGNCMNHCYQTAACSSDCTSEPSDSTVTDIKECAKNSFSDEMSEKIKTCMQQ